MFNYINNPIKILLIKSYYNKENFISNVYRDFEGNQISEIGERAVHVKTEQL